MLTRQTSLSDQVFQILMDRIVRGVYSPGSKLPAETQLQDELDVSRSTLRAAISRLEDRRLIHRQQGIGTFVSQQLNIGNPLNEFIEFPHLIQRNGYSPGYREISSEITKPAEEIAKDLSLAEGDLVLEIHKIFTANGHPIIYVVNHIPTAVFEPHMTHEEALQEGSTKDFSQFFEMRCQQRISYFLSTVRADTMVNIDAPEAMDDQDSNTPVLIIRETGYNEQEKPIVSSSEFHPGNWMTFSLVRRS